MLRKTIKLLPRHLNFYAVQDCILITITTQGNYYLQYVPVHVQQTLDAGGCSEGYDIKCCFDSKVILY